MKNEIGIKLYTPENYKNHEEAHLVFEVTNLTDKTLHILKWNTPLEGLITPCLDVKSGNKPVEYDGRMLKRGAPTASDFVTLKPKESISNRVDLSTVYDLSKPGEVKINFDPSKFVYFADTPVMGAVASMAEGFKKPVEKAKLNIKATSFTMQKGKGKRVTEGEEKRKEEQKKKKVKGNANAMMAPAAGGLLPCSTNGGTTPKKAIATLAHTNGYALAKSALAALLNDPSYKLWFGKYAKT
ncbi:MAG TPA: hypothetical protein VKH37_09670, partial [Ferruginibacter sp.]|nr:hypothetical protein [Ferruginibacter sp.]